MMKVWDKAVLIPIDDLGWMYAGFAQPATV